jgi:hypothetical protein
MKTRMLLLLGVFGLLLCTMPAPAQISKSPVLQTFAGWGVQAWHEFGAPPWDQLVAEAFHFSPDGSFYELQDEGTIIKIAVTFDVKQAIQKHKIPIDSGGVVHITLDGIELPYLVNQHAVVEVDLSAGRHTLVMTNSSCADRFECWGTLVVGKCLWGTDKDISFVQSGVPASR